MPAGEVATSPLVGDTLPVLLLLPPEEGRSGRRRRGQRECGDAVTAAYR